MNPTLPEHLQGTIHGLLIVLSDPQQYLHYPLFVELLLCSFSADETRLSLSLMRSADEEPVVVNSRHTTSKASLSSCCFI
jgi:hypothetical protein